MGCGEHDIGEGAYYLGSEAGLDLVGYLLQEWQLRRFGCVWGGEVRSEERQESGVGWGGVETSAMLYAWLHPHILLPPVPPPSIYSIDPPSTAF
jgi:hypothetical protein